MPKGMRGYYREPSPISEKSINSAYQEFTGIAAIGFWKIHSPHLHIGAQHVVTLNLVPFGTSVFVAN